MIFRGSRYYYFLKFTGEKCIYNICSEKKKIKKSETENTVDSRGKPKASNLIPRQIQQIYNLLCLHPQKKERRLKPYSRRKMKIRTMKLREAHKSGDNGESSVCSILWSSNGEHIVTASSSDNSICIHDAVFPSNAPKSLRNHREGVTALALSPNSTCLASGSIDHSVKLYKFPGNYFVSLFSINAL